MVRDVRRYETLDELREDMRHLKPATVQRAERAWLKNLADTAVTLRQAELARQNLLPETELPRSVARQGLPIDPLQRPGGQSQTTLDKFFLPGKVPEPRQLSRMIQDASAERAARDLRNPARRLAPRPPLPVPGPVAAPMPPAPPEPPHADVLERARDSAPGGASEPPESGYQGRYGWDSGGYSEGTGAPEGGAPRGGAPSEPLIGAPEGLPWLPEGADVGQLGMPPEERGAPEGGAPSDVDGYDRTLEVRFSRSGNAYEVHATDGPLPEGAIELKRRRDDPRKADLLRIARELGLNEPVLYFVYLG